MPNAELATQIKNAKSGKRLSFAFIAKGTTGKLLVGRKIANPDIVTAKSELGGGTIYTGKCIGEDGVLWFETAKAVPGTLGNTVRKVIKTEAGISLDALFRQKDDADAEETETKPAAKLDLDTNNPQVVEGGKPREHVEVEERMKGLIRNFTVEHTGPGPKGQLTQKLMKEANALLAKKKYAEAMLKLNEVEPLLSRSSDQVGYETLLRDSQANIEAAQSKRGGPQIKYYYDQALAAAEAQQWPKATQHLTKANELVAVAAKRNPYVQALDGAKGKIEPLLGVKPAKGDTSAEAIITARDKLKTLWDAQDKLAKAANYPAATAKLAEALTCAVTELTPLIQVKQAAAKKKLGEAELAVDKAKEAFANASPEERAAKLEEVRRLVTGLFAAADEAKDQGVTGSGVETGGGKAPDRTINCEKMYKDHDWFELKRRLNLPEVEGVAPDDRENITPGEMKQLWNWRSKEVDKLIDGLRSKYPTLIAKACGSNDLESDIDITFATPGGDHFGDDIKAAKEFNEKVIARFGKPAGRTFDVNIYCRDYRAIKESRNQEHNADAIADVNVDQPAEQKTGGMDFRNASAEDQDVAALMKQRRFMSGAQWKTYSAGILADMEKQIKKKNPGADLTKDKPYQQVAKQLEEAEDVYLLSLRKMLVGIQKTVAKRYPEKARTEPFQRLEALLRDPNAKNVEAQMQKLHKELTTGDNSGLAMEATDDMYLDQMAEVRANQEKLSKMPEGQEKEALKIQVKKEIFTNIFFANEAYTSEGAISHIVAGSQAGLSSEELAKVLKPTETVQSANEQLADLLKDMEHYEEEEHEAKAHGKDPAAVAGQAFVHASKYLERLLDAAAILASQFAPKTDTDPPAPDLEWFAQNVKDTNVTGKTNLKDKAEALQKRVKGLLLSLRKTSKVPGDLKKPLAVEEVKQIFGVSDIQGFTAVMMKLGQELNTVVRQREQFQASVAVSDDVSSARMKDENVVGAREKTLNVVRKIAKDARAAPQAPLLAAAFGKLDLGTDVQVKKLANEIAAAWKTALDAYEQKNGAVLGRVLPLLKTKIKAVPDVEVANEFQGVERWFEQAGAMLAMNSDEASPESKQIVTNIHQAEVLNSRLVELVFGPRWEATKKPGFTEPLKQKLLEDFTKAKASIAPLAEQLDADVIEDVPEPVKQRIVDVRRNLLVRTHELERRLEALATKVVTSEG